MLHSFSHSFIADNYIAPHQVGLLRSAPNPRAYFKGFQVVAHIGGEQKSRLCRHRGVDSGERISRIWTCESGKLQAPKARSFDCRRQKAPTD